MENDEYNKKYKVLEKSPGEYTDDDLLVIGEISGNTSTSWP